MSTIMEHNVTFIGKQQGCHEIFLQNLELKVNRPQRTDHWSHQGH